MVGELALVEAARQLELAGRDQPVDELGVVDDLVVATKLWVLVLDRVEAVRAGRHDRLDIVGAARRGRPTLAVARWPFAAIRAVGPFAEPFAPVLVIGASLPKP